jgi:hypothetical protein
VPENLEFARIASDVMPTAPFQSKLLPYLEFIRECRSRRMSYPRIAAELADRFGVRAAPSTIFSFVKVRSRRRTTYVLPDPTPASTPTVVHRPLPKPAARAGGSGSWLSYDPAKPLEKEPT